MQLAGRRCAICHESIRGILHGEFCEKCGCPIHRTCLPALPVPPREDCCRRCGVALTVGREERQAARRAEVSLLRAMGSQDLVRGLLLVVGGIVIAGFAGIGIVCVPTTLFLAGIVVLSRGLVRVLGRDPDA